jgi:hemoglobin
VPSSAKAWREHEAKIASFWANAVLGEHEYSGNPMQVHSQVSAIRTEHFAIWLTMFEETLTEVLPTQQAAEFDALARRIGRGLMMGLDYSKRKSPPNLSMGLG